MQKLSDVNANGDINEEGSLSFTSKDKKYLEELSRDVVESHNNFSVLYFQVDWLNSKLNAYGALRQIKFINPKGVKIQGKYHVTEGELAKENNIFIKKNNITLSIFDSILKELNLQIKRGDYLLLGKRIYKIYNYTIKDEKGVGTAQGTKMRTDIYAYEEDDEVVNNKINNDIIR